MTANALGRVAPVAGHSKRFGETARQPLASVTNNAGLQPKKAKMVSEPSSVQRPRCLSPLPRHATLDTLNVGAGSSKHA